MTEPTDRLDDLLRAAAATARNSGRSAIDLDRDLEDVRARIDEGASMAVPRRRGPDVRWMAAAAAIIGVVAAATVVISRGSGDGALEIAAPDSVTPDSSALTPSTAAAVVDSTVPATAPPASLSATTTSAPSLPFALATAVPAQAGPGETVTITPAGRVALNCMGLVIVASPGSAGLETRGKIADETYEATGTVADCITEGRFANAWPVVIPPELGPGSYVLCLSVVTEPNGCAAVTVTDTMTGASACTGEPLAPPSLVDGSPAGEPDVRLDATGAEVATWGTGLITAVSQTVGALPTDEAGWSNFSMITQGAYSVSTAFPPGSEPEPGATVSQIHVRGPEQFCPRTYAISPELVIDTNRLARQWLDFYAQGVPVRNGYHEDVPTPTEYFGSRWVFEPPAVEIHRFSATGVDLGPIDPAELAAISGVYMLDDGRRLEVGERPYESCANRDVTLVAASRSPLHVDLPAVHSVTVSPNGVVVATRLMCADVNTVVGWQLVRLRLDDPMAGVEVLMQIAAEDGPVLPTAMGAIGWMGVTSISDDGRYAGLYEPYNTEQTRFVLFDLTDPGVPIVPPSSCPTASDIVAAPQFVGSSVVVARWCDVGNDVVEIAVDHIRLPELELVQGTRVTEPMLPSYGNTVSLSVWHSDPSTFVVTGHDVESPNVSILNVGARQTDISRLVFNSFAFTPQELAVI